MLQRNRILTWLNIHPGEERVVLLLTLLSFSMGWAIVLVDAAALALFLSRIGPDSLPQLYIIAAAVVMVAGSGFGWLSSRMQIGQLITGFLVLLTLSLLLFRFGLNMNLGDWIYFALLIWYRIFFILAPIMLGGITGRVLHLRQTKRLFALIGNGENLARILGYGLVPILAGLIGVVNILALALVGLIGALVAMFLIRRRYQEIFVAPVVSNPGPHKPARLQALLLQPYTLLILAMIALGNWSYSTLDLVFSIQVQAIFGDTESVAIFLGQVFFAMSVLRLLGRQFLSGRLFERYGIGTALIVQPILMGIGMVLVIASTFTNQPLLLFGLIVLVRMLDSILNSVLNRPAIQILYQALPVGQRIGMQSIADGVVAPFALGLAGVFGLLLRTADLIVVISLLLVIAVTWTIVARGAGKAYLAALGRMISRRGRFSGGIDISDPTAAALVQRALTSPHAGEVLYAIELLQQRKAHAIEAARPHLLAHQAQEVRLATLDLIRTRQIGGDQHELEAVIDRATDPTTRAAAIRALCATARDAAVASVVPLIADADPLISESALIGLLCDGGPEGSRIAQDHLATMLDTADPDRRARVATIMGAAGGSRFVAPLCRLLADSAARVRRAALQAAGNIGGIELLPEQIIALDDRRTANAAATGIERIGPAAVPLLAEAFAHSAMRRRVLIAGVLGRIGGEQAVTILRNAISEVDPDLRIQVYRGLLTSGYRATERNQVLIRTQMRSEAQRTAWLLGTTTLLNGTAANLLLDALATEIERCRDRVLLLLALISDPRSIAAVRHSLAQGTPERRAYALEIIDMLLPVELKPAIIALFDDLTPAEQLKRLHAIFPQPPVAISARLADLISNPQAPVNEWTRRCAVYAAVVTGIGAEHEERINTATAAAALERVTALRKVHLFMTTPGDILAELAGRLKEQRVAAETQLFMQGDLGESLYIVLAGEVRIHLGQQTLNVINAGEVFGEMAVLDPGPRAAAATTTTVTHLLRLNRHDLDTLIDERPEITRGLIRTLNRNLRNSMSDLVALRTQLAATQQLQAAPTPIISYPTAAEQR